MKALKTLLTLSSLIILLPISSFAASTSDILLALDNSRNSMIALMKSDDRAALPVLIKDAKQSSNLVDSAISAVLLDDTASKEEKINVVKCKVLWEASKQTRDDEIIPLLLTGDTSGARKIARNVQSDRFKQMQSLLK